MNIFITGGTTGMGLELAKLYLAEGHRVGVCGRDEKKFHDHFSNHANIFFYSVDVADRERLHEIMGHFVGEGSLDLVIANAGISVGKKGPDVNFARARNVMDTNVIGLLNTFEKALEYMTRDGRGHLVAMSSVAGRNGLPGAGPYSASKAAVTAFCESLAIDLHSKHIDVTIVCPGFVKTPLTDLNDHPMPFMISAEKAAQKIKHAIDKKKLIVSFPWPMDFLTNVLRLLPRSLYIWGMRLYRAYKR